MADNKKNTASYSEKASLDKIYSLLLIIERKLRLLEGELTAIKQKTEKE